jgi:hypothetical protein
MNVWSNYSLFIAIAIACGGVAVGKNQAINLKDTFSYSLKQAPAQISVSGSSTLGKWNCTQSGIGGLAKVNISAKALRECLAALLDGESWNSCFGEIGEGLESHVDVIINAKGFDCDNGRMQRDLVDAIKGEEHPSIVFGFTQVVGDSVLRRDGQEAYLEIKLSGDLLFAGERRKTTHTAQIRLTKDNLIEVRGQLDLGMRDFGIKPPSAFFGLIRADDNFQVGYQIKIEAKDQEIVSVYSAY